MRGLHRLRRHEVSPKRTVERTPQWSLFDGAGRLGLCRPWPGCGAITRPPDSKGLAGEPTGTCPAEGSEESPLRCLEEGRHPTEPTGYGQTESGMGRFRRGQTLERPGDCQAATPTTQATESSQERGDQAHQTCGTQAPAGSRRRLGRPEVWGQSQGNQDHTTRAAVTERMGRKFRRPR